MKGQLFRLFGAIQGAAALCALGAITKWAPVCEKVLILQSGRITNMKCYYAGKAGSALAVVLLAAAFAVLLSKRDHKKVQIVVIAGSVMLYLLFTRLIGVCSGTALEVMACESTELWVKGCAVITVVAAIADILLCKTPR